MLSLFSTGNLRDYEQIRGIKKLVAKESVKRLQKASWRTFCTGVSVTIEVERRIRWFFPNFVYTSLSKIFFVIHNN